MALEKFINEIGITTFLDRIEKIKIATGYGGNYAFSVFLWYADYANLDFYEFKLFNPRTNVTEEFFIPVKLPEISDNFSYLVSSCHRNYYNSDINQMLLSKLKRLFGNDFSDFLHHLLISRMEENKVDIERSIGFLSLAVAEIPETSKDTLMLILEHKGTTSYVKERVFAHKAMQNLAAFK
jgi:hypothetical protein